MKDFFLNISMILIVILVVAVAIKYIKFMWGLDKLIKEEEAKVKKILAKAHEKTKARNKR